MHTAGPRNNASGSGKVHMSLFRIADVGGEFDHHGKIEVSVLGQVTDGKQEPFSVVLIKRAGPMVFQFQMTPDQSRRLREAMEDAEAKAEILTAAI